MKKYKIAICLGGQSRTWKGALKSFHEYFSADDSCEFTVFGHTWDKNSWRIQSSAPQREFIDEVFSIDELTTELKEGYRTDNIIVDPQYIERDIKFHVWSPMLKSAMLANNMKTKFELENDMRFDLVVKTRWDVIYEPGTRFNRFIRDIVPNALYANVDSRLTNEFRYPLIDDLFYYGPSRVMNIMDGFYHAYVNDSFYRSVGYNEFNPGYALVGVGVMLHKWATLNHIAMINPGTHHFCPTTLRKHAAHLRYPEDFKQIEAAHFNFVTWARSP